jgi:predicted Zn-ribbon and HTH transcriptional regulator
MKRTKAWWGCLSVEERKRLVFLEHADKSLSSGYSAGGMIPDDCCECGACSQPHLGSGLCPTCLHELIKLIEKADMKMQDKVGEINGRYKKG